MDAGPGSAGALFAGPGAAGWIKVIGARQHNLRNISVAIPKNKLVVITGVSGSGKSSLAFDTLYAEGQRRYVESLSAHARQYLERLEKPDVDAIEGLSPAIAIEQRMNAPNPRSTVATATEIYDYLRVLYAAAGQPHDPATGEAISRKTMPQIAAELAALPEGTRLILLAPVPPSEFASGGLKPLLARLKKQGFIRVRVDGEIHELDLMDGEQSAEAEPAMRRKKSRDSADRVTIEIVIDRLVVRADVHDRLIDSIRTALRWSQHEVWALIDEGDGRSGEVRFSTAFMNPNTGFRLAELTPRHFSFNSHQGACPACQGLGVRFECDPDLLVPDRRASLKDGAVKSWWARNAKLLAVHKRQIDALVAHFHVDPITPFERLPRDFQQALFFGTGTTAIKTGWKTSGATRSITKPFEGLCAQAQRLYESSESEFVRKNVARFMNPKPCPACGGRRLKPEILAVTLRSSVADVEANVPLARGADEPSATVGANVPLAGGADEPSAPTSTVKCRHDLAIDRLCALPVSHARQWIDAICLSPQQRMICAEPIREILNRLRFLDEVGLGYLTLDRGMGTLSGGEAQRIRLATQIGSGLSGVLYVLDEPSIGLHQRDNSRLIGTLEHLRDLGNTVIVVEHDEETMRAADYLLDLGPGAGPHGGEVLAAGTPADVMKNKRSLTGRYLSGGQTVGGGKRRGLGLPAGQLTVRGASENNLKNITVSFPIGMMTCVTGVSGSGKSTLVDDVLRRALARYFYGAKETPGRHCEITGLDQIDKLVVVDQSAIGRSPRSNPVTYLSAFTPIRELFAELPAARVRGFTPGTFSFNTPGGRCEACEGDGQIRIDMHFLSDVYVTCEACGGRRYQRDVLDVTYKGRSIADVLDMTFEEAAAFFRAVPPVAEKMRTVCLTGLGYLKLGQPANTLSGGEAQRIKLSAELSKRATGRTLYLLDEPTTGLHFQDIEVLLGVLFRLRDAGNTLVVIEHNLDVIRSADWIIDLGPGGGDAGGRVVATGSAEQVAACANSETGRYLAGALAGKRVPASLE
jgi:excinuclease ABC subunit A